MEVKVVVAKLLVDVFCSEVVESRWEVEAKRRLK